MVNTLKSLLSFNGMVEGWVSEFGKDRTRNKDEPGSGNRLKITEIVTEMTTRRQYFT